MSLYIEYSKKNSSLDYYESGADLGLSDNMLKSFLIYQGLLAKQFRKMQRKYGLVPINENRSIMEIHKDLQDKIDYFQERCEDIKRFL
jgi:dTMP kinase